MSLRKLLYLKILFIACSTIPAAVSYAKANTDSRPNVLLIYTDDHRYSGIHALGGQAVHTPNLDQLAANGIVFNRAYLMGSFSGATCIPSRASLQTGRQLFKLKGIGREIPQDHLTIGETFQKAGYNSHIVGKWHQDRASLVRSFNSGDTIMSLGVYLTDHFRMPFWDWDPTGEFKKEDAYLLQYTDGDQCTIQRRPLNEDDKRGPTGTEFDGPHSSEVFADSAVGFFNDYDSEKPFFMYLAFHAPHDPRHAPQRYKDMYPENEIDLTPSYMPQHPFDNGHLVLRDEKLASWPRTPEIARKELSDYYAIISHLDEQIGRVIQGLKDSRMYDNTLIVMAGDSGLAVGNHGLLGKQSVYDEDGIHVPFIVSGELIKDNGRRIDAMCYIHDIFPTICDLAGVETPDSVTGKSQFSVIMGDMPHVRDYTYHAYMQFQRAYRKGDYKLIEYVKAEGREGRNIGFVRGSRVTQLFNYRDDPWETLNLAVFPENEDLLKAMQAEMKQVAKEVGDTKESVDYPYDFWDYYN